MAEHCILTGGCEKFICDEIKTAIDSEVVAPFVRITIKGEDESEGLTVGNQSSPDFQNRASISSFQYGQSGEGGIGASIEVVDEDGGVFSKFVDKVSVNLGEAGQSYRVQCKWGWVFSECNEKGEGKQTIETTTPHTLAIISVQVKFDVVFKFVLECVDLVQFAMMNAANHTIAAGNGDAEGEGYGIKEAIAEACEFYNPGIKNIKYLRKVGDNEVEDLSGKDDIFFFKEKEIKKANCKWHTKGESLLVFLHRWIRPFRTEKHKGIRIKWDDKEDPTLVFWEDGSPGCNDTPSCHGNLRIGTYIVNGGECSPVIEFIPQIKWNFATLSGPGGMTGKSTAKNLHQSDAEPDCDFGALKEGDDPDAPKVPGGTPVFNVVDECAQKVYGKQEAEETMKSDAVHARANKTYETITAELRIQGDPRLDDPITLSWATAGIVVINPFHITGGTLSSEGNTLTGRQCPEWLPSGSDSNTSTSGGKALAASTCNQILSNKCWQIKGVSHEIRLGAYTTTISCFLPVPGSNSPLGQPFGGCPGGYLPQGT